MTVDVKLDLLDIDQCPSEFFESNAFMGTANCDYETTSVSYSNLLIRSWELSILYLAV